MPSAKTRFPAINHEDTCDASFWARFKEALWQGYQHVGEADRDRSAIDVDLVVDDVDVHVQLDAALGHHLAFRVDQVVYAEHGHRHAAFEVVGVCFQLHCGSGHLIEHGGSICRG